MSGRDPLSGTTPVDSTGAPYPLATIDYYIVGTTTREDTFTTAALSVANSNPVTLGSDGRVPEIFFSQTRMKRVFKDADGNTISGLSWDGIDKTKQRVKSASAPSPTYPGLEWHDTSTGNLKERNAANDAWIDRGAIDSIGNTASVTETLTGTETGKLVTPDGLAATWQRGSNITPSAGTVSLPSTGGGVFNIAAGNFSAISTAQGGRKVLFVFGGASVITHNATSMILPGGANITTEAGDVAEFTNEAAADASGANWRMTSWQPDSASGTPIPNYAASNAEQVTGSSLLKWVTPGTQHRHESAVKSWLNYAHDTATVNDSYGVTSVDDDGAGLFGVNMSITFGNTTYAVSGWARSAATTTMHALTGSSTIVKTTTAIDLATRRGTDALIDSTEVGVNLTGTLA